MDDPRFEIEINPVFEPPIIEGFIFKAIWKGVISMSGFDPDYYNAERRARSQINEWLQRHEKRQRKDKHED